jgi:alkanesulfonate monooxygenase SsuD/methylene tetrahydromethanopterin reductase-like flavin-dependent oxidoreductase (luciferase family)
VRVQVGMVVPRGVGDPRGYGQPNHKHMVRYGQRAEELGFDSVWFGDHFFLQRPWGRLDPYHEAWTTMTAVLMRTERIRVGSMVLSAAFRHPALLAHMAGALQELADGRLVLGIGTGSQLLEHETFGLGLANRVDRLEEYLQVLTALLKNEHITLDGKYYHVTDGRLLMTVPPVPIWIAASGERMLRLTARYAQGWNGGNASNVDGEPFVSKLTSLRTACRAIGRDPDELEASSFTLAIVSPDEHHAQDVADRLREINGGISAEEVRARYVLGTPDQVIMGLRKLLAWGATHLIVSHGASPSSLWSDETLELFGREVLPALR